MKDLYDFNIEDNLRLWCYLLDVEVPQISYDNNDKSNFGYYNPANDTLELDAEDNIETMVYGIAIGIRRKWQLTYKKEYPDFKKYSSCFTDEEFYSQPSVIDALAFGGYIYRSMFGKIMLPAMVPDSVMYDIECALGEIIMEMSDKLNELDDIDEDERIIIEFVEEVSDILDIEAPEISHDTSYFESDTMKACYVPEENTIYVDIIGMPSPDDLLAIAHELRHAWQCKNDKEKFSKNYKQRHECDSIEEYNLQFAEIDAHAFAAIAMGKCFGMTPLFEGFSEKLREKINERIKDIKAED